jgi:hypothetical protein
MHANNEVGTVQPIEEISRISALALVPTRTLNRARKRTIFRSNIQDDRGMILKKT